MIKYDPHKLLAKIAPVTKIKKLLKANVTLKRAALDFVDSVEFIDKKNVAETALKVIKAYKERIKADPDLKPELLADPKQLIQRVQNEVIVQIADGIKQKYDGEKYVWLPSDAVEPRPEHQLNYGLTFIIGEGEMPGDEWGCRCGMQILVEESQLNL